MFKQKPVFVANFRSDLAYFDGLSETILCAGLVKPKPGVFQFCWPVLFSEKYSHCFSRRTLILRTIEKLE